MPEGWRFWLDWLRAVAPENTVEIKTVETDQGRCLGYVRLVGKRREQARLEEHCWSVGLRCPPQFTKKPLLRDPE
jgi:hypothetical protein